MRWVISARVAAVWSSSAAYLNGERAAFGFAEDVLLARGEALCEGWEVPDAMLELADQ
jgi:hypothetical protein